MLALSSRLAQVSLRLPTLIPSRASSVFMKKQKKMDPEVAKQREARRRKRLEREIRQMQKHSKKPKPVDEMTIDVKSAKNIDERIRAPRVYTEAEQDEFAVVFKQYTHSRNTLQRMDDAWIRKALQSQKDTLKALRELDESLYKKAIQPDDHLVEEFAGPATSVSLKGYAAPDGDYLDTTRTWT